MFSVITAKRDLYLLPLYPAGALIAAEGLARLTRRERLPRALPYLLVAPLGILTLAAAAAGPLAVRSDERLAGLTAYVLPGALVLGIGAAFLLRRRATTGAELVPWTARLALIWTAGLTLLLAGAAPRLDPIKSARGMAEQIAELPQRPTAIPCFSVQPEGYRFYSGRPFVRSERDGDMEREVREAFEREGGQTLILAWDDRWKALPEDLRSQFHVALSEKVGRRQVWLLAAGPETTRGPDPEG
ncbi:MAG: hypothetical protein R3F33_09830 [Planctomycetota bacterium]